MSLPLRVNHSYRIKAARCYVQSGQIINKGMVIGEFSDTGLPAQLDFDGRVLSIIFDPYDHALMVVVQPFDLNGNMFPRYRVDASRCYVLVGDCVAKDTILGNESESGLPVFPDNKGKVYAIGFDSDEHELIISISPEYNGR